MPDPAEWRYKEMVPVSGAKSRSGFSVVTRHWIATPPNSELVREKFECLLKIVQLVI